MTAMTRMQKARAKMLMKHPFFATLLMSTPMIETYDIPTAATDMKSLFINPDFIESLPSDEAVLTLLGHEVMHIALMHGLRLCSRNPTVANMAMDYAINLILVECGFEPLTMWLYDKKYEGLAWEQIYDLLMKQIDKSSKGKGDGKGTGGKATDMFGDAGGMIGDVKQPEGNANPAETAKTERSIQQRVAQAASMARMQGKLAGNLERLVGELLDPKVPWKDLLRDYMTRTCKDDEVWSRRNRRFSNVYLPARHSEKMGEIVLIGDTSGSIGNDELTAYMSEAGAITEDVRPERVRILWCDTRVAGEQVFEEGEPLVAKPQGGGGTDMRVGVTAAEKYEPEVIVLFTDGYTPWPEVEPDCPLIVCCTTDAPVPVGYVVRI